MDSDPWIKFLLDGVIPDEMSVPRKRNILDSSILYTVLSIVFPMSLPSIQIGRPQRIALALLAAFVIQCVWLISQRPINETDYRYARCGREMWEHRPPLLGYFTSCGNIHDGVLAYRAASAPLSVAIALDRERPGAGVSEFGGTLAWTKWAIRLPFVLFGVWLGE